jgi:hypothetical protein
LFQKILGTEEVLDYGIWVSLSEKSFNDYIANFDEPDRKGVYFGWICNNLLGYDSTISIPSDVYLQSNGNRPVIIPTNPRSSICAGLLQWYYYGGSTQAYQGYVGEIGLSTSNFRNFTQIFKA